MSNPLPSVPPMATRPVAVPVESSSVWDRISTWASENKTVVYTIAGVAVVFTGAGVFYYLNSDSVSFACLSSCYRRLAPNCLIVFQSAARHQSNLSSTFNR